MDCLVTKFNAVVNNDNIPMLEIFEQFTQNAIELSGNSDILSNDTQKWALNHFFITIGATSNSTLWQKIKGLYLPLICNKNAATAATNYTGNTAKSVFGTSSFSAKGGLICSNLQDDTVTYSGYNTALGVVMLSPDPDYTTFINSGSSYNIVGVRDSSAGGLCTLRYSNDADHRTFGTFLNSRTILSTADIPKGSAYVYNSTSQKVDVLALNNGIMQIVSIDSVTSSAISSKGLTIQGHSVFPLGIAVVGVGLTKAEAKIILSASNDLMTAFTA